ncbi:MAG TPA: DsbA family protein [Acidimicrobiia bacterium]|nr:DsbA family protein [Acidimicrobiia bacterium]
MTSSARTPSEQPRGAVIEVFADVLCPFTHVGLRRIVAHRAALGVDVPVVCRAWPLERVNGEPLAASLIAEEVVDLREQVAPDLFSNFDPGAFPETSLPALSLASAAYGLDVHLGERVSLALRDALFEQGRNIGDRRVLADIAAELGAELPDDGDTAAVLAEWQEGQRRGVLGSPHFFAGDESSFCPALDIRRVGDRLHITADPAAFDAFMTRAFSGA